MRNSYSEFYFIKFLHNNLKVFLLFTFLGFSAFLTLRLYEKNIISINYSILLTHPPSPIDIAFSPLYPLAHTTSPLYTVCGKNNLIRISNPTPGVSVFTKTNKFSPPTCLRSNLSGIFDTRETPQSYSIKNIHSSILNLENCASINTNSDIRLALSSSNDLKISLFSTSYLLGLKCLEDIVFFISSQQESATLNTVEVLSFINEARDELIRNYPRSNFDYFIMDEINAYRFSKSLFKRKLNVFLLDKQHLSFISKRALVSNSNSSLLKKIIQSFSLGLICGAFALTFIFLKKTNS